MRVRQSTDLRLEVRVGQPTYSISDITPPTSTRNRKHVQIPCIEPIVYKKVPRARRSSRRSEYRVENENSSFSVSVSNVEDEISEMNIKSHPCTTCIGPEVGVHIPRDNILEEENSLPLTKLEYKLENEELARESVSASQVRLTIRRNKSQSPRVPPPPGTVLKSLLKVWEPPGDQNNRYHDKKLRRRSTRKVQECPKNVPKRRANLRSRRLLDLSELPLSHVKQMRQKMKNATSLKDSKFTKFLRKKLNGRLILQKKGVERRARLRLRKRPAVECSGEDPSLSLTVFDADLARPSRPIHRPVRYLDSLNQNAEHIAIKKLNLVDKLDLPYDKDALSWNRSHSKNKQNTYCYCGGPGFWHEKMVRCVRCSQWFHERCLAPRPYTMPIISGDTAWLFVCSLCNSGSECLKRMDMSWADLVHLALYDLTLKTSRKFHDFEVDLMPHLLDNWTRFQLYKHFNIMSDEDKTSKVKEWLVKEKSRFERQSSTLWGLRVLSPPPRPLYRVPDIGIISERTVLDEYSLPTTARPEKNEKFTSNQINKIYKDYTVTEKSDLVNDKSRKVKDTKINSNASHTISDSKQLSKLLKAKVDFKPLKLPKEILNERCRIVTEDKKLPCKKRGGKSKNNKLKKSSPVKVKPLPFEIARDLHKKGYPKVAMKFAAIVPPKIEVVKKVLKEEMCTEQKSKKKKSKKEKEPVKEDVPDPQLNITNVLESLIPEKPNFLGENNPFQLGSVEEQRKARQMICNRKLKEEDLTRWRSKIKKRTYKLDIEEARKVWRKECASEDKNAKTFRKRQPYSAVQRKSLLCAGTFTSPSGKTKIILSDPTQAMDNKIESQVEL